MHCLTGTFETTAEIKHKEMIVAEANTGEGLRRWRWCGGVVRSVHSWIPLIGEISSTIAGEAAFLVSVDGGANTSAIAALADFPLLSLVAVNLPVICW